MARSKVQRRVMRNHERYRGRHDLNVVPMIDMMVILVFFLIFTAVFTRTNILELKLPAANAAVPTLPEGLQLEIVIHPNLIEVTDRKTGLLKSLPSQGTSFDLNALSDYLQLVKAKYPQVMDATLLLEPTISYDTLVQVMDTVRVFGPPDANFQRAALFPNVSVGDAPT